jgi:hypothetical protein
VQPGTQSFCNSLTGGEKMFKVKMSSILFLVSMLSFFGISAHNSAVYKNNQFLRILVLVIASDDLPVYQELQWIWRCYMEYNPEQVTVYFLKGDSDRHAMCSIEDDTIWVKAEESITPGLMNKTIAALKYLSPRITKDFDYVVRANLSTFFVFPRLLKFLETQQRTQFYCGSSFDYNMAWGGGIIMSADLVQILVQHANYFWDNYSGPDDVVIGKFFTRNNISLVERSRLDFMPVAQWYTMKDSIAPHIFFFRIKNEPALRLADDIFVHRELLKMFYDDIA